MGMTNQPQPSTRPSWTPGAVPQAALQKVAALRTGGSTPSAPQQSASPWQMPQKTNLLMGAQNRTGGSGGAAGDLVGMLGYGMHERQNPFMPTRPDTSVTRPNWRQQQMRPGWSPGQRPQRPDFARGQRMGPRSLEEIRNAPKQERQFRTYSGPMPGEGAFNKMQGYINALRGGDAAGAQRYTQQFMQGNPNERKIWEEWHRQQGLKFNPAKHFYDPRWTGGDIGRATQVADKNLTMDDWNKLSAQYGYAPVQAGYGGQVQNRETYGGEIARAKQQQELARQGMGIDPMTGRPSSDYDRRGNFIGGGS